MENQCPINVIKNDIMLLNQLEVETKRQNVDPKTLKARVEHMRKKVKNSNFFKPCMSCPELERFKLIVNNVLFVTKEKAAVIAKYYKMKEIKAYQKLVEAGIPYTIFPNNNTWPKQSHKT